MDKNYVKSTIEGLKSTSSSRVQDTLLKIRSKVITNDNGIQLFRDCGGLEYLLPHLRKPNERILDLTLSILGNCCLEEESSLTVGKLNYFGPLVTILKTVCRDSIVGRACRVIGNMAQNTSNAESLHSHGAVTALVTLIESRDKNTSYPTLTMAVRADEDKSKLLQKLLQSKKPEDLQHANRLIKSMVREEERRSEANFRRAHEVGCALDSAGLLQDMLLHAVDASPDEEQIIHELFGRCATLRPALQRLAATETNQDNLEDILGSIDLLDEVGELYKQCMSAKQAKKKPLEKPANTDSLLDFAGTNAPVGNGDELLVQNQTKVKTSQAIDELGDIFSAKDGPSNIAEPLKPVNLMSNGKDSGMYPNLGSAWLMIN